MAEKGLVVITGNGLSIASSSKFTIENLGAELREQLAKDDALGEEGLKIADGLASYLDGPAVDGKPGFEQLVGAFDSLRRSGGLLGELKSAGSLLADAVADEDLKNVAAFCDRVYRRGTSIAAAFGDTEVSQPDMFREGIDAASKSAEWANFVDAFQAE